MDDVDRFLENARDNGSEAVRTDRAGLPGAITDLLRDETPRELICAPDPSGLLDDVIEGDALAGWDVVEAPTGGSTDRFAAAAGRGQVGLLRADVGLIPHGSVAVRLTPSREGAVSLMPPTTVTVVRGDQLHRDSQGLFRRFADVLREEAASWILVSGPSSTADLGSLVQGVHGPSRSCLVVVEEEASS